MEFRRDLYTSIDSAYDDARNCSVRSFAIAACVSYDEAYKLFEKHGRKHGHGTPCAVTMSVLREQFPNFEDVIEGIDYDTWRTLTLPKFAKLFNRGHYVVHVR